MSPSLAYAFNVLNRLRPWRPSGRARLEIKANRVTVYCLLIAAVFMALMLMLAAWHVFVAMLGPVAIDIALTFGVAASCLGMRSMASISVGSGASVLHGIKNQYRELMREVDWDLSQASMLESLAINDLMRAREFLELKSTRLQERIKLFIGGPDKIALFTIFGLVWLLYKELPAVAGFKFGATAGLDHFAPMAIWGVVAFCTGILAAAVASSYRLRHYTYQKLK